MTGTIDIVDELGDVDTPYDQEEALKAHKESKPPKKKRNKKEVKPLNMKKHPKLISYLNGRSETAQGNNERIQKKYVKQSVKDIWQRVQATLSTRKEAEKLQSTCYFKNGSAIYLNGWTPIALPAIDKPSKKRKRAPGDNTKPSKKPRTDIEDNQSDTKEETESKEEKKAEDEKPTDPQ